MKKSIKLKAVGAAALAVALAAVVTLQPWAGHSQKALAETAPTYTFATLTPDDHYASDTIRMKNFSPNLFLIGQTSNPSLTNYRAAVWSSNSVNTLNEQTCATWVGEQTSSAQEGLALRITSVGGVTKAVTVTKNIMYGATWAFNAHVWDSSKVGNRFTQFAQFDMRSVDLDESGRTRFMPWNVCMRAVGNQLTFKVWYPNLMTEPSWTDANYTRTATIPAPYDTTPGYAGWYVGHLPNNLDVEYSNLTTQSL